MTTPGRKPEQDKHKITAIRKSVLVEINEEAYKQNTVYCSWQDILTNKPETTTESSSPREHPTRAVTS